MKINEILKDSILKALEMSGFEYDGPIHLEHPDDMSHGDYSTNIAMVLAPKVKKNPRELAETIKEKILEVGPRYVEKVEVAGPGFINFYLSAEFFQEEISKIDKNIGRTNIYKNKTILVEHSSPNLFKPFHIGHVMNNTIGESIARLAEFSGADTLKISYPSDVSLGIGKAVWAFLRDGVEKLDTFTTISEKLNYMGECYVKGNKAFEENEDTKKEVKEITQKIYMKVPGLEWDAYEKGKEINLEYFKSETKRLGSSFDNFIYESEAGEVGKKIVLENVPNVFQESEGAVIFDGEKRNLHTRVFINSEGYPTYEAKDIGLLDIKFSRFSPDVSILITDVEQESYYRVVLEAAGEINKEWKERTIHKKHGRMSFKGERMSSRLGGVPLASEVLDFVGEEVKNRAEEKKDIEKIDAISIAAIKLAILKVMAGKNIDFDPEITLSFEGDSGPYLLYTYARCNSILEKAFSLGFKPAAKTTSEWEAGNLEKLLCRFPEEVEKSIQSWEPHHVAGYLLMLAREFNSWYGNTKIIDESNKNLHWNLWLVKSVMDTLKSGLYCLGLKTVDKM